MAFGTENNCYKNTLNKQCTNSALIKSLKKRLFKSFPKIRIASYKDTAMFSQNCHFASVWCKMDIFKKVLCYVEYMSRSWLLESSKPLMRAFKWGIVWMSCSLCIIKHVQFSIKWYQSLTIQKIRITKNGIWDRKNCYKNTMNKCVIILLW